MLKKPTYRSFRLHPKITSPLASLPTIKSLFAETKRIISERPKQFAGLALVHLFLTMLLVRGFSFSLDIAGTKSVLDQLYVGGSGKALTVASLFGQLVNGSSETTNAGAGLYQSILSILLVLAIIWMIRQRGNTQTLRVRDAFYKGMYPVVPFVLVLLVVGLQLIPAGVGGWLYAATITGGLAVTTIEQVLWILLVLLLITLSLYMISSSIFALVIVTLPNMTPMRALRSARNLVLHRRWKVASKVFAMLGILFCAGLVVMIPFLLWLPQIAEPVFLVLSSFVVIVPVVYIYNLYLRLLDEKA